MAFFTGAAFFAGFATFLATFLGAGFTAFFLGKGFFFVGFFTGFLAISETEVDGF